MLQANASAKTKKQRYEIIDFVDQFYLYQLSDHPSKPGKAQRQPGSKKRGKILPDNAYYHVVFIQLKKTV